MKTMNAIIKAKKITFDWFISHLFNVANDDAPKRANRNEQAKKGEPSQYAHIARKRLVEPSLHRRKKTGRIHFNPRYKKGRGSRLALGVAVGDSRLGN
jgi:hypothetical protein